MGDAGRAVFGSELFEPASVMDEIAESALLLEAVSAAGDDPSRLAALAAVLSTACAEEEGGEGFWRLSFSADSAG